MAGLPHARAGRYDAVVSAPPAASKKKRYASEQRVIDRRRAVCHERPAAEPNPLTDDVMVKRPDVVAKMIEMLHSDAASVQRALCDMNCHCSMLEIDSWRYPQTYTNDLDIL